MRIALYSLILFSLTACYSLNDPGIFPSGYHNHSGYHHSTDGATADDIGYDFTAQNNRDVVWVWRQAASDLIDEFERKHNIHTGTAIYLRSSEPANAFTHSYDNALRTELTHRGYRLAQNANGGELVDYNIFHVLDADGAPVKNFVNDHAGARFIPADAMQTFVLTLTLGSALGDPAQGNHVGALYALPYFGYDDDPNGQSANRAAHINE